MNRANLQFAFCLLAVFLGTSVSRPAEGPLALRHSLFDPGTNAQTGASQGRSVAIDGNIAVIGVPGADVGDAHAGVVKIYDVSNGTLLHSLTNPSPAWGDNFGDSVAISGMQIVVGVPRNDTVALDAGSAYVYDLSGSTPTLPTMMLTSPNPTERENFGSSVAISGTRVVVGTANAVAVYVYDIAGTTPTLSTITLTSPSHAPYQSFGHAIAISDTRIVIGAIGDNTGALNTGRAYIYDLNAATTPNLPLHILTIPSPAANDRFGIAVAISGRRVVIGALEDDTGGSNAGIAYVYDLLGPSPTVPMLVLPNPSGAESRHFGASVAISATCVIVGAGAATTEIPRTHSAYVYDLIRINSHTPSTTLIGPSPLWYDVFPPSVAISGSKVVVGLPSDDTMAADSGGAYVYDLDQASPNQPTALLNDPSPASYDKFGSSVAISGKHIVIGAYQDDTGAIDAGSVFVYDLASRIPKVPAITLPNPSPMAFDGFGSSVAISGTRVVVGTPNDGTGAYRTGKVYVYDLASTTPASSLVTLTNPNPGDYDHFGWSVAIFGDLVVVGAIDDNAGAEKTGSVYVYELGSTTPAMTVRMLTHPQPAAFDGFGSSVAISGTRIVVGAYRENSDARSINSAYVYDLASASATLPIVVLTNPNPANGRWFANAVAISGSKVVVGALFDNTGATDAGVAYVFDVSSTSPTVPTLTLTNPIPSAFDNFGNSVAISGALLTIGAYRKDTGALDAGGAFVYDLNSSTPNVPVASFAKPSPKAGDNFGNALAIDGTTIVVAAYNDDTGAVNRGAAYVFDLSPTLRIDHATPGFATLSWTPATSSDFILQYTDNLSTTNWLDAPSARLNPVTILLTNATRFHRLFQP